jgi:S-adenosylmethionine/arginine decarboxylase-like enzyme
VVGRLFHTFGAGAGVTGTVVLAESHLAIHTWPEIGAVTLDVYVCNFSGDNSARAHALFDEMVAVFSPARANRQAVERGRPGKSA